MAPESFAERMALAYSDDLRRKFAEAYERGGVSLATLAARFGVSLGWAEKLRRTQRKTGQIERPQGGKRGPTLVELQLQLWEQHRLEVSLSRLWTVLSEMKLTLKKSHSTPPNRKPKQSLVRASTGWRKRAGSIRRS